LKIEENFQNFEILTAILQNTAYQQVSRAKRPGQKKKERRPQGRRIEQ